MESITIKVDDALAKEIDKAMGKYYTTKTEFIREAIRDKLIRMKQVKIRSEILANFGKYKGKKTTPKEDRDIREQAVREIERRLDRELN